MLEALNADQIVKVAPVAQLLLQALTRSDVFACVQDARPVSLGDGTLDMTKYCAQAVEDSASPANCMYELIGSVDHSGSMEAGHYVARCKSDRTGKWYRADDYLIDEDSTHSGLSSPDRIPYMLFFRRKE